MAFYYPFNQRNVDFNGTHSSVVKRAGNDQLQNDMVNLILSHDETATREVAIALLEKYAFTIERLLHQKDIFYYEQQAGSTDQLPGFKEKEAICSPLQILSEKYTSKSSFQPVDHTHTHIPVLEN